VSPIERMRLPIFGTRRFFPSAQGVPREYFFATLRAHPKSTSSLRSGRREFNDDAQAAVGNIFGDDTAAVRFDGTTSDRQAETETAGVGGV